MIHNKSELDRLGLQPTGALRVARLRALRAGSIHQARGAFYMAELCLERADAIRHVLAARNAEAA